MRHAVSMLGLALGAICLSLGQADRVQAQVPIYSATPVTPVVVGFSAQRRGLFGRRVVYRPVVAPVAVAPVAVARPVVTVARPVVARPVVVARPSFSVAYPAVPVTSFYAPPVVAPIRTYRVPTVVPLIGW